MSESRKQSLKCQSVRHMVGTRIRVVVQGKRALSKVGFF